MKNLYNINKVLVIINIFLGFTIYLGLLFLIPLGIAQVAISIVLMINLKKLTKEISTLLSIYCIITTIVLISAFFMYCKFIPINDLLFYIGMAISILLAFFHLYITYRVHKMLQSEKKILQNQKELSI